MSATTHHTQTGGYIDRMPVILPSLVWIFASIAGLAAMAFRGVDAVAILPVAAIAAVPALLGVLLGAWSGREWVQILLMLAWSALALLACITLGFWPSALLFLTVPAIAALFDREKVLEGLIIAGLIAGVTYFAMTREVLPEMPTVLDSDLADWGLRAGLASLCAFGLACLYAASLRRGGLAPTTSQMALTDGVDGGLIEYDARAELVQANGAAQDHFGGRPPRALKDLLPDGHTDKTALTAAINLAQKSGQAQSLRVSHGANGHKTAYDLKLSPLPTRGWLVHSRDRTDDEAQMEVLRQRGATAVQDSTDKTLFFAGVSHELRTPLNAIIGFSDMMRSRLFGPLPGKYAEYADLIHESGQHMLDLIGDVLDLSKVEAGKYELNYDTFDAADVIRSSAKMIRPAADAASVAMDVNLDLDQPLLIQADRRAVRQILLNLLSNAVKFSDKGGRIDIDAQAIDGDLELTVTDEGVGMSAEDIARIGDPYAQGEAGQLAVERGSGLGLSLVQSLTELHGGQMKIKSEKGEGTRVKIVLPLQAD